MPPFSVPLLLPYIFTLQSMILLSFQFYIRTLVFPTWVKMISTPRKYYPIPVDSCLLPYPASSLLQPPKIANQTVKLVMILLWGNGAVQGARPATRYCRKWLLTTHMKTLYVCSSGEHPHKKGRSYHSWVSCWHDPKSQQFGNVAEQLSCSALNCCCRML